MGFYMVVETFRNGDAVPVYRRFRDRGRMMPAGVFHMGSWVTCQLDRCDQLMETDDPPPLDQWVANEATC